MRPSETVVWGIPVAPVPAARPRVSRYGTYYPKNYADFRRLAAEYFKTMPLKERREWEGTVMVSAEFICTRPAKPARSYPRGDVDNYAKALFDAVTKAGVLWKDDTQIITAMIKKRYADVGEDPGIVLSVEHWPE